MIANKLEIQLKYLILPKTEFYHNYWHYEKTGEKLGTIFIHTVVENFTKGYSIFENHAGSEKGYFITAKGKHIPLAKYSDREKYKAGNKDKIIHIPDLILIDFGHREIINVEGKKYQFSQNSINKLNNYDFIEKDYGAVELVEFEYLRFKSNNKGKSKTKKHIQEQLYIVKKY
ncbi:hypothetical protein AGMMS49953_07890 [Endomicrobiia bacterium]|nr:hypothetical protein AGMMS49953_07890 [Endomicrobiia bacterium]